MKVVRKMKYSLRKLLLTVGISAALVAVISSVSFGSDPAAKQPQNPQGQNAASSSEEPAYIIGIYKGYVAVFRYGSDIPSEITNVPVTSLTDGDILLLTKGIEAADEQELRKRLEDYT